MMSATLKKIVDHSAGQEEVEKVPTGVRSIDLATGGGFPIGSFVLLYGETGSWKSEFAYTTCFMNAMMSAGQIRAMEVDGVKVTPLKRIWFITFSKTKDDVLRAVRCSFSKDFYKIFSEGVLFKDFVTEYYVSSFTSIWKLNETVKVGKEGDKNKFLRSLANFLEENADRSLIIIYTLVDTAKLYVDEQENFISFLQGLRTKAKDWKGIVYGILQKGYLSRAFEAGVISSADVVLQFSVEKLPTFETRRIMRFMVGRGLPPSTANFTYELKMAPDGVLEAEQLKTIEGLLE